ncbi:alpha/beta hydrolase [Pseudomonas sp. OIL-1]|uniref:alpha/beta hydrolase n=1 Tax=Pseudomonas sp. OIL-1 TaxID=2706126 RepID=UPI002113A909|nr:alpha/beta hydrolase [Pseudomonas sp. OIL-1]
MNKMNALKKGAVTSISLSIVLVAGCLDGGSSNSDAPAPIQEPVREQQARIDDGFFIVDEESLPFEALPGYPGADRWWGVHQGAGYRVEVPENWNGMLVMWAHGYRGEGKELTVDSPPLRTYLLENEYAWAASSYSANFYDVRAGVEDTNALALAFKDIAEQNGRALPAPGKYYIAGVSMGGHVAGAAIERETLATANNVVEYAGAAPMCGVMGDTALFDYFTAYGLALFEVAGVGAAQFPVSPEEAQEKLTVAHQELWFDYETNPTPLGLTSKGLVFFQILQNLSGGERPIYPRSFGGFQDLLQGFLGTDGTITGITAERAVDTTDITYRFEGNPGEPLTPAEQNFNATIAQAEAVSGANAQRDDGLRWVPAINGEFDVPVVTVHTLGDLFVPISMQQIYRQRAEAAGSADLLVQRAIRAPAHCDFSIAEFTETFDAMIQWEQTGVKPPGDDLLDPAEMANSNFGCQFTRDGFPQEDTRKLMPPCDVPE